MSRPNLGLRDAALGYASPGIPVLPLHYPLPHHGDLQALNGDRQLPSPPVRTSCSCRDPGCGQPAKHPLGGLVPRGVKDATTNRARVLAWWTRHPQANIGLATGHRFDVLDVDGPAGEHALRALAAAHGLASSGRWSAPVEVAGISIWPRPAWATSTRGTWSMWTGGAGAAMWSPHPAAMPPATPTNGPPAATSTPHPARSPR
jgi:Bifunctional DNA primase/polymerase, N-terminal